MLTYTDNIANGSFSHSCSFITREPHPSCLTYKGVEFFAAAERMASGVEAKRGKARRHFRGQKAVDCIKHFRKNYRKPEYAIDELAEDVEPNVGAVIKHLKENWPMFGPWAGFKISDLLERWDLAEIEFPIEAPCMFKEPVDGAKLISENKSLEMGTVGTLKYLQEKFAEYKAPPRYERFVNVQELETICCKYKAHVNDDYPIGKIIVETQGRLKGYGSLARRLSVCLPERTEDWQL